MGGMAHTFASSFSETSRTSRTISLTGIGNSIAMLGALLKRKQYVVDGKLPNERSDAAVSSVFL
jgi:hypothetical protein